MAEPNRVAGGTPEIVRRRRDNIHRNAVRWNALGLPAAGGSGGSLLSSAVAGDRPAGSGIGEGGGRGGAGEGDGGGGGGGSVLAPLEGLVKRWPGRGKQITELAGLIGEVSGEPAVHAVAVAAGQGWEARGRLVCWSVCLVVHKCVRLGITPRRVRL